MLRLFAEVMTRNMRQRVLVVNQPGAGGALAATTVANAAPDGYTLLLVLSALHTIGPAMHKLPFDAINDFTFVSLLHATSSVLLVPAQSPAKNFAQLVELLKRKGVNVSYGSPAFGSPAHFQGALLAEKLGVPAAHVAYRGGPQVITDLSAGLIDFAFSSTVGSIGPVAQRHARALAVGTRERMNFWPDVPTFRELGYQDLELDSWFGIGGPKGLPKDVQERIAQEIATAKQDPLIRNRAEQDYVELLPGSQEAFLKLLASDYERVGPAVKRMGMKPE
jgi:tripartite-type tricarboxylate transporter receptor subunit TctC